MKSSHKYSTIVEVRIEYGLVQFDRLPVFINQLFPNSDSM